MSGVKGKALAFAAKNEGGDLLELDFYDVIGDDFWGDGIAAKGVRDCLKRNAGAKRIKVAMNSTGGIVTDGIAIYNMLKDHPAQVEVQIDALAASIASVIAMAGDAIKMASNGFMMIHNPSGWVRGEASDMRSYADALDKMRSSIADTYAARSGQSKESVLAAMDVETWYTADEARALGYVDEVIPAKKMAACLDVSYFRNAPKALTVQPPTGRANEKENDMRSIALALGLPETATEGEILVALAKLQTSAQALDVLVALSGKDSADGAKGVFVAWQGAAEQLATFETAAAEAKAQAEKKESSDLLAKLQSEGKITPHQADKLWPTWSLESKRAFSETAVKVLGKDDQKEKGGKKNDSGALVTADGKAWEDLKPVERAEIFQADCALYAALKEDYELRTAK